MATFGTAEEADAEQKKLEEAARTLVNPFAGEAAPAEQSNMPEPILCDWLRDHGIEPPQVGAQSGTREWSEWWDESCRNWSVEQRAAVWEALDRVRFFEAVEEPERPVVYAIAESQEHYYDAHSRALRSAHRSRGRAEEECAGLNEGVLEEDDGPEDDPSRQDPLVPFCGGRAAYPNFDDRPVGHWPNGRRFFQVVPIEVEGNPKDRLCVVSRCVYIHCAFDCFRSPMEDGNAYTFVRGFGSRAAAEDFRRKKIDQARRVVAPGRIETFPDPEELEKLAEGIRKLGLTTPDPDELSDESSRFGLWWPAVAGVATPEQRLAAWELLEGVSLFEVFEVKLVD